MANLPSQHPNLSLHLTDSALTPLITSARAQSHLESLTALSHTALDAHESAQRFGLGAPQRIMVEHGANGPVVLQSFLNPHPPTTATTDTNPQTPLRSRNNTPRQHQGALALAVENRAPAATYTTTTPTTPIATATSTTEAHLRGGAGADEDEDEEPLEEQLRTYSINPSANPSVLDDDEEEEEEEEGDKEDPNAPPLLLGIVIAPSPDETGEARRAAARLERVGREIQGRWFEFHGTTTTNPAPPPSRLPRGRQGQGRTAGGGGGGGATQGDAAGD